MSGKRRTQKRVRGYLTMGSSSASPALSKATSDVSRVSSAFPRFATRQKRPATREAPNVKEIMDLVVRNSLASHADVDQLRDSIQEQYRAVFDPSKRTELRSLEDRLTETLQRYAPDTAISLTWSNLSSITIPMPETEVRLSEDGYDAQVQQTGHGLQRAFILTMLQHLVAAREDAQSDLNDDPPCPTCFVAQSCVGH